MPVYYCYQGDYADECRAKPDAILAQGADDKEWVCFARPDKKMNDAGPQDSIEMIFEQQRLHREGKAKRGSEMQIVECPDVEALRAKLKTE